MFHKHYAYYVLVYESDCFYMILGTSSYNMKPDFFEHSVRALHYEILSTPSTSGAGASVKRIWEGKIVEISTIVYVQFFKIFDIYMIKIIPRIIFEI